MGFLLRLRALRHLNDAACGRTDQVIRTVSYLETAGRLNLPPGRLYQKRPFLAVDMWPRATRVWIPVPGISVIWVHRSRRRYQKRGVLAKTSRIEMVHFYLFLAKVGNEMRRGFGHCAAVRVI